MNSHQQQSFAEKHGSTPPNTIGMASGRGDASSHRDGAESAWPGSSAARPRGDRHGPSRAVCLLDVDSELGGELSDEERAGAQRLVLPTIMLDPAPWELSWLGGAGGVRGEVRGFLVLSGGLTSEVLIGGRICTRLIGPADLMLLDNTEVDSIPVGFGWSALTPARVAIFDDRLLVIGRHWPGLLSAILRRAAQTTRNGFVHQAISQLPRVEDRLLALLWTLTDRQGIVRADGVWLDLPATHDTLARMIGARRPTVSLALRALTEQGFLHAERGGWLIDHSSLAQLAPGHRKGSRTVRTGVK